MSFQRIIIRPVNFDTTVFKCVSNQTIKSYMWIIVYISQLTSTPVYTYVLICQVHIHFSMMWSDLLYWKMDSPSKPSDTRITNLSSLSRHLYMKKIYSVYSQVSADSNIWWFFSSVDKLHIFSFVHTNLDIYVFIASLFFHLRIFMNRLALSLTWWNW